MTNPIVVDASVALKWILGEQFTPHATALLLDAREDEREVVGAPILPAEVTNALYQHVRRGDITADEAGRSLSSFLAVPIHLHVSLSIYSDALRLARRYNLRATYDCLYLAVARAIDGDLWTADEHLVDALPRSVRWVRHIRDYEVKHA